MANYDSYNEDRSKKICFKCQDMLDVNLFRVREKKRGRGKGKYINNICKDCEQGMVEDYRRTDLGMAAEIVRRTKAVCKKDSLPFDLDREWVLDRLNSIGWKCELTGLPMSPKGFTKTTGFKWDSISTDRLNPNGGYTKDNIRFILNQINVFRQNHPDEQMYMLAEALLNYRSKNAKTEV